MMDIISDYLEFRDYSHSRLDGSMNMASRQEHIEAFNEDPDRFVFLLSTRAGGLGLNLMAADTGWCCIKMSFSASVSFFHFFLGSGPDRGRSPVEWGDFPSVRLFVCSFVHLLVCLFVHSFIRPSVPPLMGPRASQAGLSPSQAGLGASQSSLRASQPGLRGSEAGSEG